jgi:trk system potassium uptake protein
MVQRLLIQNISNYFELAEGFSVVEVNAPRSIIGKTIEQLELRRRFRINLVAMKRKISDSTGRGIEQFNPVPPPTEVVREGDVLALVGSVLDLANFMALHE